MARITHSICITSIETQPPYNQLKWTQLLPDKLPDPKSQYHSPQSIAANNQPCSKKLSFSNYFINSTKPPDLFISKPTWDPPPSPPLFFKDNCSESSFIMSHKLNISSFSVTGSCPGDSRTEKKVVSFFLALPLGRQS